MVTPYPAYPAQRPAGPPYRVRLSKVTSYLLLSQRRSAVYTGTLEQLESRARSALTHNLFLGWWGFPFGIVWTAMALVQNASAMRQVRALAAQYSLAQGSPTPGQVTPGQPGPVPPPQGQP